MSTRLNQSASQSLPLHELHHNTTSTASSSSPSASGTPAFQSYAAYLESIVDKWPEYRGLIEYLKDDPIAHKNAAVMVAEVHDDKISCKKFKLPFDTNAALNSVLSASRDASVTTQTQIIFIQSDFGRGVEKLIDAIGLLYDIDPAFFQVLDLYRTRSSFAFSKVPRPLPPRRFLGLSGHLACQVLQARNIAGREYAVGKLSSSTTKQCFINKKVFGFINTAEMYNTKPLHGPPLNSRPSIHVPAQNICGEVVNDIFPHACTTLANHLKDWNVSHIAAANSNPYLYIYPLLQMAARDLSTSILEIRYTHNEIVSIRTRGDEHNLIRFFRGSKRMTKALMNHNAALSSELDDFTDFVGDLQGLQKMYPEVQGPEYDEILLYIREVLDDGRRATRMVQDLTQSEIGLQSMEASQRSIEEAVSVKRLTQLAFIFIPLSFVTSLYGMNVKEISGDGVRIWVFFVTAICVMFLVFFMWLLARLVEICWSSFRYGEQRRPSSQW